jgi:hypothetical protein
MNEIDPLQLFDVLPKSLPLVLLKKYINLYIEIQNTQKRNLQVFMHFFFLYFFFFSLMSYLLQVIHQLLRVREVSIRTSTAPLSKPIIAGSGSGSGRPIPISVTVTATDHDM